MWDVEMLIIKLVGEVMMVSQSVESMLSSMVQIQLLDLGKLSTYSTAVKK